MKVYPKTKLGKWSFWLIIATPFLFFVGTQFAGILYESVDSGGSILDDIAVRPMVSITMLLGVAAGIAAFIIGVVAIRKHEERAFLAYLSTLLGGILLLFAIGQMIVPD